MSRQSRASLSRRFWEEKHVAEDVRLHRKQAFVNTEAGPLANNYDIAIVVPYVRVLLKGGTLAPLTGVDAQTR